MVEIVLVCCECQRTECRIRYEWLRLSMSLRRETSFFRIRNNISNAFVCLSIYIKKIYTDVCEWSLRSVGTQSIFIYRNEAVYGSY